MPAPPQLLLKAPSTFILRTPIVQGCHFEDDGILSIMNSVCHEICHIFQLITMGKLFTVNYIKILSSFHTLKSSG